MCNILLPYQTQLNRKSTIGLESMTGVHAAIANSTSKTISVEKIGNIVDINVSVKLASAISAYQVIFTLPEGYRPIMSKQIATGNNNPYLILSSNGKAQVQGDYTANHYLIFGTSYIL